MSESDQSNPQPVPAGPQLVLPDEATDVKDLALWAAVIAILALLAYGPAIRGGFIWDDDRYVTANPALRTADGLYDIWMRIGTTPQYYPLTHTTFWIEYQIWGAGPDSAMWYHIVNVVLHGASAIALWFVLRRLKVPAAWLIAAIFALHPMNVESVAWVTERKNVLSGLFFFLSILAYLHAGLIDRQSEGESDATKPKPVDWGMYALAFVLYIAGLLSKTAISPMPAVLLLVIWWKRGRIGWADIAPLVPFFAFGIAMSALTGWMERETVGAEGAEWNLSIAQRLIIAGRAIWFYAGKLIFPRNLMFSYPRWDVDPSQAWQWAFGIAAVVVTVLLFALRNRIGRGIVVAWLIFVGMLVPALGFVNIYPMRFSFVADHFAYLASVGLIAIVVSIGACVVRSLFATSEKTRRTAATWAGGVLLALLAIGAYRRASVYGNVETLWRDTLAKNEKSWLAAYNLGMVLQASAGRLEQTDPDQAYKQQTEALAKFQQAVAIRPDYALALRGWGDMLLNEGDLNRTVSRMASMSDAAVRAATQPTTAATTMPSTSVATSAPAALREDAVATTASTKPATHPTTASVYDDKARAKYEEALAKYNESLKYDDASPYTHNNKGLALIRLDRKQEAIGEFQRAIAIYKRTIEENKTKSGSFAQLSQPHASYAPFHMNLAEVLKTLGKENWEEAVSEYRNALKINPNLVDARKAMGLLLARMGGRDKEAFLELAQVRQARPDDADVSGYLGYLAVDAGKYDLAMQLLRESLQKQPDNPVALAGVAHMREVYENAQATTRAATRLAPTTSATMPATGPAR